MGATTRQRLTVIGTGLFVGVAITIATLGIGTDIHHSSENGYVGDARLLGSPFAYTYQVTSDSMPDYMANQVWCALQWICEDPPGPATGKGPIAWEKFAADVVVWFGIAAVLAAAARESGRRLRRPQRGSPPSI